MELTGLHDVGYEAESSELALIYTDRQGKITYCNEPAQCLLNCHQENLLGLPLLDCFQGYYRVRLLEVFQQTLETGRSRRLIVIAGEQHLCCNFFPLQGGEREAPGVGVLIIDVSETGRLREDLNRAREELRTLSEAVWSINADLNPEKVMNRILEMVYRVVPYSYCGVFLSGADGGGLFLAAQAGVDEKGVLQAERVEDLQKNFRHGPTILEVGKSVKAYIPLTRGREMVGGIFLIQLKPEKPNEQVRRFLNLLARMAGLALRNAQLFQQIHELAIVDGLTKLYNRQYFDLIYRQEAARAKRLDAALSLIMIDINGLKEINDKFGHLVGDTILVEAAGLIQASVRNIDYVFRYGGDELIIILVEADEAQAARVVERIRDRVENWNRERGYQEPVLTLSIGWASRNSGKNAESAGGAESTGGAIGMRAAESTEGTRGAEGTRGVKGAGGAVEAEEADEAEDLMVRADRLMYRDKEQFYRAKFSISAADEQGKPR